MSGQFHPRPTHPVKSGGFVSPIIRLDVAVKGEIPCPCMKCLMSLGMWNIRYLHQTCILFQSNNDFIFVTSNNIDSSYNNVYLINFVLQWNAIAILSV